MNTVLFDDIHQWLNTNISPKKRAYIGFSDEASRINENLDEDDILTIISPEFYDSLNKMDITEDVSHEKMTDFLEQFSLSHISCSNIGAIHLLQAFYNT